MSASVHARPTARRVWPPSDDRRRGQPAGGDVDARARPCVSRPELQAAAALQRDGGQDGAEGHASPAARPRRAAASGAPRTRADQPRRRARTRLQSHQPPAPRALAASRQMQRDERGGHAAARPRSSPRPRAPGCTSSPPTFTGLAACAACASGLALLGRGGGQRVGAGARRGEPTSPTTRAAVEPEEPEPPPVPAPVPVDPPPPPLPVLAGAERGQAPALEHLAAAACTRRSRWAAASSAFLYCACV